MNNGDNSGRKPSKRDTSGRPLSEYVKHGGELHLSNPGQLELLRGMKERGVPLRATVRGYSMFPFIRDLDVLTIAPLNNRKLRKGEVVAFIRHAGESLAIHRVIRKKGQGWLIKGDNCSSFDDPVKTENILGRVIRVERNGREVRLGLRSNTGSRFITWLSAYNLLTPLVRLFSIPLRIMRVKR